MKIPLAPVVLACDKENNYLVLLLVGGEWPDSQLKEIGLANARLQGLKNLDTLHVSRIHLTPNANEQHMLIAVSAAYRR